MDDWNDEWIQPVAAFEAIDWDAVLNRNENGLPLENSGYEQEIFRNREAASQFTCSICLAIAREPRKHDHPGCKTVFCLNCVKDYIRHNNNNGRERQLRCVIRCGGFLNDQSAITGLCAEDQSNYNKLELICPKGCDYSVNFHEFEAHGRHCRGQWCALCNEPKDWPHSCKAVVEELKQALEQSRSRIKELEGQIAALSLDGIRGISNPIRSRNGYFGETCITCVHNGNEVTVKGLSLDATGGDLRRRLEASFGTDIGPIIRVDHTVIKDDVRLRQHQISRKPVQLIALGRGQRIEVGQTLVVEIEDRGPVV